MKKIAYNDIVERVAQMCIEANTTLPEETRVFYSSALETETSSRARKVLQYYEENLEAAKRDSLPVCQDTGLAVFFIRVGYSVLVEGKSSSICDAVQDGVRKGYTEGYLRKSIVSDPLFERKNTGDNTPAIIHIEQVEGDRLEISFAPKGGGAENMSRLFMLPPSAGVDGVVQSALKTVTSACANPCPPVVVGIGIGGNFEYAPYLAKKALFREGPSPDLKYAELEKKILVEINKSGVGPQGFGGDTTAFDVRIEHAPCHIASMPVAVNLNCHVHRHAHITF